MGVFYEDVLRALLGGGVRFVIVGGTAVVLRGVPRMTADLDLVVDLEPGNVAALAHALTSLGFKPRAPLDPMSLADRALRDRWHREKGMLAFSFWHPDRPLDAVDILYACAIDYSTLAEHADSIQVGDLALPVASASDLLELKRGTGRKQDEADVDALERLLEAESETE